MVLPCWLFQLLSLRLFIYETTMTNPIEKMRISRIAGFLLPIIGITLLPGCGAGVGDASGRVTYKNKPVVCGSVVFVGPDGMTRVANLNQDGTYLVSGVGVGKVQVGVISQDPARPLDPYKAAASHGKEAVDPPIDDSGRAPDTGHVFKNAPNDKSNWTEPNVDRTKWFPLPRKFEMVHTSGLSAELKKGLNQNINFDLQ
jgi:hypothetical protein